VPTITYIGRSYETPNVDATHPAFIRGVTREVTQAWMDRYFPRFGDDYIIEGYEAPTVDAGNDGVPDSGWSRADIAKWLSNYDIKPKGYATKTTLLSLVETVMSPDGVEETEALIEESLEEETQTGDEE
jgi:hypothetical protein